MQLQPALGCDEEYFYTDETKEAIRVKRSPQNEEGSEQPSSNNSLFEAIACCFLPTDP